MKNIKVCALLCAVALSANTALPVMAAENAENTQLTEAMTGRRNSAGRRAERCCNRE